MDTTPLGKRKRTTSSSKSSPAKEIEVQVVAPSASPTSEPTPWQITIEGCIPSIVSVRFSQVAAFDTESSDTSEASGFIVDEKLGIVLTNRHVVGPGPFVGTIVMHDHEEVEVVPIYRDPIHDFGFLRFDPKKIKYMKLKSIPLRPDLAHVGLDIRVVGNDAAEKLSILSGSISRLDRNAPEYGEMTYNDFNTFYLQSAASTSGGSSGSPVLDIHGNAVALQAGGHMKASTDFFFPLDRVVRALKCIQEGKLVPRGTIQVQWLHRPYDEVKRLGLRTTTEAAVRKLDKNEIGMLVAETVIPESPSAEFLEEGDILVRVNGKYVTKFVPLEAILDENVGGNINVEIERGGEPLVFDIPVIDLHSITPDRYLEIGGSKLNNLSYQLARQFCLPCKGVYVADPVGMFRLDGSGQGWLIKTVDNKPTENLDQFIEVVKQIPDRERIPVEFSSILDIHTVSVHILTMERHWTKARLAVRNDETGLWDFHDIGAPLPAKPLKSITASLPDYSSLGPTEELMKSMVKVSYYIPIRLDGFPKNRKFGSGLIIDAEKGLVVVSKAIVPYDLGDLHLTFADSVIIPGKVLFVHPTQNFSIVQYDPKLIGDTPIKTPKFSDIKLKQGMKAHLLAFNHNQKPVHTEVAVTDTTAVTIPISSTPRPRAVNFESINIDSPLANTCSSGVFADSEGNICGLWLTFLGERTSSGKDQEYHMGVHIDILKPVIEPLLRGITPTLYHLSVEVVSVSIVQCRFMGVTDDYIKKVENATTDRPQLFLIRRIESGTPEAKVLQDLDLLLELNGKIITKIEDLDCQWQSKEVTMKIVRKKKIISVKVPLSKIDGEGTKRFVMWAGALIHEPHKAVRQQSKTLPSGCYVSARAKGSPCMLAMVPTQWITHINSIATPDLDTFLEAVRKHKNDEYVRVKLMSFDNVPSVTSIKINNHYFPTVEMVKDSTADIGWRQVSEPDMMEAESGLAEVFNMDASA